MTGPAAWMGVAPNSTRYVHTGYDSTGPGNGGDTRFNWASGRYLASDTRHNWQTSQVAEYYDANGDLEGAVPAKTTTGTNPVDISGFPACDLIIRGNGRVQAVAIDGVDVTAQCLYTTAGGEVCQPLPTPSSDRRVIVPRSTTAGASMVITAVTGTPTWNVDIMAAPIVEPMAMTGSYRAPDLWSLELTSTAAMQAQENWNYAFPWASGPESYGTDSYGIQYRESWVGSDNGASTNQRLAPNIKWKILPARTSVFCQWWEWIGGNVWAAGNDRGVKQSGIGCLPGGPNMGPLDTSLGFEMEHSLGGAGQPTYHKNPLNAGVFGQDIYTNTYSAQGSYFSDLKAYCLKLPERWYCNEIEMVLNTVGVADGEARMWVNGHLIYDVRTHRWRKDSGTLLDTFFLHIFHGGQQEWETEDAYYRQAKVSVSTQYIGVHPDLLGL